MGRTSITDAVADISQMVGILIVETQDKSPDQKRMIIGAIEKLKGARTSLQKSQVSVR